MYVCVCMYACALDEEGRYVGHLAIDTEVILCMYICVCVYVCVCIG